MGESMKGRVATQQSDRAEGVSMRLPHALQRLVAQRTSLCRTLPSAVSVVPRLLENRYDIEQSVPKTDSRN